MTATKLDIPHWTEGSLPDRISARIIADTISESGARITTFEARYNRYFHSEVLTHTILARNSASSRAIPYPKLRKQIMNAPAAPRVWSSNQQGMQGGREIEDTDRAIAAWHDARLPAISAADWFAWYDEENDRLLDPENPEDVERAMSLGMTELPLHKSIPNRLIEPWMFITVTITATDWEGFFNQRSSHRTDLVLPEFGLLASQMEDLYGASRPAFASEGEWHTPYIRPEEYEEFSVQGQPHWPTLVRLSTARTARTSYLTQTGMRDPAEDFKLFDRLCNPGSGPQHASPFQHVATPADWNEYVATINPAFYGMESLAVDPPQDGFEMRVPIVGNARRWLQLRHVLLGW